MSIILDCINTFYAISGQKISLQKSFIAFSRGMEASVADRISSIFGLLVVTKLDRYLGIPSIMGHVNSNLFHHGLDRINGRLEGWKAKTLTLAGRTVLTQTVLNSTPISTMQSTFMPTSLCHAIDKKVRNFIWGGK